MALSTRSAEDARPTLAELQGDNHYASVAQQYWLNKPGLAKLKLSALKNEIWDVLESEKFAFRSLLILENLRIHELYLWPNYSEESPDYQVLLMVLLVNAKGRESIPIWESFADRSHAFSSFFKRVLSMGLGTSLSSFLRTQLLSFIIAAFHSLDNGLVRKECAPLVSISIWQNLSSVQARDSRLDRHIQLRKAWRASERRYDAADEQGKAKLRFERSWLYTMILDFLNRLYSSATVPDDLLYCERFIEFLVDLESQLPTRRYVNSLLHDLHVLPAIRISPLFDKPDNALLRDLYVLLRHFVFFPIDEHTGSPLSTTQVYENHCERLARLQRTALKHFKDKLTILALSNYASIDARDDLAGNLEGLTDAEILDLCSLLGYRTSYPSSALIVVDRRFLMEVLLLTHERRRTFQELAKDSVVRPTEETLYEPTLLRNETYNGARPLAIPKLNLQYLTVGDFLWRSFILYRCEAFFEIRKDVEDALKRVRPSLKGKQTVFDGFSKMALPISKPAIIDVSQPKVGDDKPASVRAEIALDFSRLNENIRREWDSLKPDDVVFLVAADADEHAVMQAQGSPISSPASKTGLKLLRTAEVVQVLDENGRHFRSTEPSHVNGNGYPSRPRSRKLVVNLDPVAYQRDSEKVAKGRPDIYESINLLVRRKGRENNFKPILESVRSLTLSDLPIPRWFQDVFLGFGDPASASYRRLTNSLKVVDYRDTFLDWQHLTDSFSGVAIQPANGLQPGIEPPYVLETSNAAKTEETKPSKKRRRDQQQPEEPQKETIAVSSYRPPNNGPYQTDAPKLNRVRFTPAQIEAVVSGTQPGLTVIVGPPGTGKTDVATQIINNIYHDFPEQRTLLIAHSNQALNQLFQKITALDIDERHLLRLGHGEEDLDTEASYSKHGRVDSFLENRGFYLAEVDRLAMNFNAPGAHGNSCETAGYFNSVYVKPAWAKYQERIAVSDSPTEVIDEFPFHIYFANAPQPLFPADTPISELKEIAAGCYRHIQKLFTELEDIRPFELLRHPRDKANHLLLSEARIIAMTATHAAMRRQSIAGLGFHYHNVIMEEAAQITEIETVIPFGLQKPPSTKDGKGELPLQRIVLIGDHLQNAPVIQNLAFRTYANLEQSLFLRFIRLGVPVIHLDAQGRARPSIADLYRWRYARPLKDLPLVSSQPEFLRANPGFRYEVQFIDVPDYKGRGEQEATPHWRTNLGEAEYAVAIYQYMRLLGYPRDRISILAAYAGQRALINEILAHRCARNPALFGLPGKVDTVDRYQGEQNDFVILSLVRTARVGYLRDLRRMTVALSRARLGLYVLGRREVFAGCWELREVMARLAPEGRPDRLRLVVGEMWSADTGGGRAVGDDVESVEMEGVEHLGKYVYEMTQARAEALRRERGGGGLLEGVKEEGDQVVEAEEDGPEDMDE